MSLFSGKLIRKTKKKTKAAFFSICKNSFMKLRKKNYKCYIYHKLQHIHSSMSFIIQKFCSRGTKRSIIPPIHIEHPLVAAAFSPLVCIHRGRGPRGRGRDVGASRTFLVHIRRVLVLGRCSGGPLGA